MQYVNKLIGIFSFLFIVASCIKTSHSDQYNSLLRKDFTAEEIGKLKFFLGDMGGIYPHTLKSNGFAYKLVLLTMSLNDENPSVEKANTKFGHYGFTYPKSIWNAPDEMLVNNGKPAGLIFGQLSGRHPLKGKYLIETADLGCGSCHGGPKIGSNGLPTDEYVLGMPNTSLNLEAFASTLFDGYKQLIVIPSEEINERINQLFPGLPKEEYRGLIIMIGSLRREVQKIVKSRDTPSSYKIGGPGLMNGVGAIRRGTGLTPDDEYDENNGSIVSVPALVNRSFRSNLLYSGNYAPKGGMFNKTITVNDTSAAFDKELAKIISLFTIGTMGYDDKMAAASLPEMEDVMKFLSTCTAPAFPGKINEPLVEKGRILFRENCQSCHGTYEGNSTLNQLTSFPNVLVPCEIIGTDSIRSRSVTEHDFTTLSKMKVGKRFSAKLTNGYVAPILTGVWATAPYFHNGSVPTVWHLLNPSERPQKFKYGGHQFDFEKLGIKGTQNNTVFDYEKDFESWSKWEWYDTEKRGNGNKGHEFYFKNLNQEEKFTIIEFLKTFNER
ncbi:MAG: hypothetical protein P8Q42_06710 [Flavobacteriales bacterium]|nr:hypothetical protein [Flavobacteriales bacterium]